MNRSLASERGNSIGAALGGRGQDSPRYGLLITGAIIIGMVMVLPPALAIAVLGAIVLGTVLLARPHLAVYLLVFAVPYESLRSVPLGGLNATITEFVAFCGGAAFLMRGAINRRLDVRWAAWRWPLLLFSAVMIASMTQAIDIKSSIKELLKLGEMLLTYLLVLTYIDSPARLRRLLLLVALAALSQALYGILQTFAHFGPASFLRGGVLRASGTFAQPNPFAGYLNFTLPLALAGVVSGVPIFGRLTRLLLIALSAAVLLSVSRGALLASLAAAGVVLGVYLPKARPVVGAAVAGLVSLIIGAVFGLVPSSLTESVAGLFGLGGVDVLNPTPYNWAVAERLAHILAGLHMFMDHPWLGVGIGNYGAFYPWYKVADVWSPPLGHAHNYYINVAAEAGLVGLAAFLIVLIAAFVIVLRLYRRSATPLARTLTLGSLGVLITVVMQSFFDNIFVHAMEAQLALVMGIATVACRLSVKEKEVGGARADG